MAFNQSKYANEFAKEKYDRLNIQVPKGRKAIIETRWKEKGYKSLNSYINDLINKDIDQGAGEGNGQNTNDEKILGGGKMRIAA